MLPPMLFRVDSTDIGNLSSPEISVHGLGLEIESSGVIIGNDFRRAYRNRPGLAQTFIGIK
jgi:hypothetical protein